MINNRQAGRRRGRNNNPRQNGGGGNRGNGDSGNRIDNRARGNAAQLLEKYRNLARDAQLSGDRVNVEYYLQFADHYFRVLADNRARQEEQQQRFRRNDDGGDQFGYDGPDGDDDGNSDEMDDGFGPPSQFQPQPQQERRPRSDEQRERRPERQAERQDREPREPRSDRPDREPREPRDSRRREERPRREPRVANDDGDAGAEGLSLPTLPPSISRSEPIEDSGASPASEVAAQEAPAKPRRGRPRKTPEAAE